MRLRIGHVLDDVHRVAERRVRDGRGGQRHRRCLRSLRELGLDVHAGAELAGCVVEDRLDADVARRLVDDRIEGGDLAELRLAEGVGDDLDRAALRHRRELLLRDGEVDERGADRLERHDRRAAGHVLAEVHRADAEDAGEGGVDRLALDRRLDLVDVRVGGLELGHRLVVVLLRDDALLRQTLIALQGETRELELRLGGRELGALLARIETHEDVAFRDVPAGLEEDLLDDARQISRDGDAVDRGDAADRVERAGPRLLLGDDRRDGLRGRRPALRHRCFDL